MSNQDDLEEFRQEWKLEVLTKKMASAQISKSTSSDQLAQKERWRSRTEIAPSSSKDTDSPAVATENEAEIIKKVEKKDDPANVRALNAYVEATRFERYQYLC